MLTLPQRLRPYSRACAERGLQEAVSINGFGLPEELISFYQTTDGLDLEVLDTDVLTLEAACAYAKGLECHPLSQALGLWPITESNDSNPYCVCLNPHLHGAVLRLCHDGVTRMTHNSLSAFLSSLEALVVEGTEFIDDCKPQFPLDAAVMASADRLLSDLMSQQESDETVLVPLLSACSPVSIASCLSSTNIWVREEAAILLGKHVYLPARDALMTLANAGAEQDNVAAAQSLSIINRAFFAPHGS